MIDDMTVRFFATCISNDDVGVMEISEQQFITVDGDITYERHTISTNGVEQICLTRNNELYLIINQETGE